MDRSNSGVRRKLRQEERRLVRQTAAEGLELADEQRGGQAVSVDEAAEAMVAQEDGLALETVLEGTLQDVRHALRNLDLGTYGICDDCGEPILPARLEARPQATLCLPCKTKREHGGNTGPLLSRQHDVQALEGQQEFDAPGLDDRLRLADASNVAGHRAGRRDV